MIVNALGNYYSLTNKYLVFIFIFRILNIMFLLSIDVKSWMNILYEVKIRIFYLNDSRIRHFRLFIHHDFFIDIFEQSFPW